MAPRPRLKPSFRPVRRGAGTVQLGLVPESGAVLLAGLAPSEVGLLERLDGSLTEPDVYALAAGWGIPRRRATELLRLLAEQGLLTEPPRAAAVAPEAQYVVVAGSGPVAEAVTALLRDSGVGRVATGGWAADLAEAVLRAVRSRPPGLRSAPEAGPHLVVTVVGADGLDVRAGRAWQAFGVPILPVAAAGSRVVVGPLVNADRDGPCLRCLELTRAEAELGWLEPASLDDPRAVGTPALEAVAAGAVALIAGAVLAGEPVPLGVSVEARLPWPRLDHRRWERHPGCRAHGDAVPARDGVAAEPGLSGPIHG